VLSTAAASAQEFRVYTRVYDRGLAASESKSAARAEASPIVSRSITLFHAGKTYDFIPALNEVIILEPARPHRRFTILNPQRNVASSITFDELNAMLKVARTEAETNLVNLQSAADPAHARILEVIAFQLDPKFDERWQASSKRLLLEGRGLTYRATCSPVATPELAEAYLRYADWMCRLNYVLHPGLLLPEPRLALNASLQRKGMVPVSVELQADFDVPLHLQAQHDFHWELDAKDRSLINDWETQLKSPTLERMTIHEYQRTLLISQTSKKR
jgi:hypothetical protein